MAGPQRQWHGRLPYEKNRHDPIAYPREPPKDLFPERSQLLRDGRYAPPSSRDHRGHPDPYLPLDRRDSRESRDRRDYGRSPGIDYEPRGPPAYSRRSSDASLGSGPIRRRSLTPPYYNQSRPIPPRHEYGDHPRPIHDRPANRRSSADVVRRVSDGFRENRRVSDFASKAEREMLEREREAREYKALVQKNQARKPSQEDRRNVSSTIDSQVKQEGAVSAPTHRSERAVSDTDRSMEVNGNITTNNLSNAEPLPTKKPPTKTEDQTGIISKAPSTDGHSQGQQGSTIANSFLAKSTSNANKQDPYVNPFDQVTDSPFEHSRQQSVDSANLSRISTASSGEIQEPIKSFPHRASSEASTVHIKDEDIDGNFPNGPDSGLIDVESMSIASDMDNLESSRPTSPVVHSMSTSSFTKLASEAKPEPIDAPPLHVNALDIKTTSPGVAESNDPLEVDALESRGVVSDILEQILHVIESDCEQKNKDVHGQPIEVDSTAIVSPKTDQIIEPDGDISVIAQDQTDDSDATESLELAAPANAQDDEDLTIAAADNEEDEADENEDDNRATIDSEAVQILQRRTERLAAELVRVKQALSGTVAISKFDGTMSSTIAMKNKRSCTHDIHHQRAIHNPKSHQYFENQLESLRLHKPKIIGLLKSKARAIFADQEAMKDEYETRLRKWQKYVARCDRDRMLELEQEEVDAALAASASGPTRGTRNKPVGFDIKEAMVGVELPNNVLNEAAIPTLVKNPYKRELFFYEDLNRFVADPLDHYHVKKKNPRNDWSAAEQDIFSLRYKATPKQFGAIANHLPGRTHQECVLHYYLTKKHLDYRNTGKPKARTAGRGRGRGRKVLTTTASSTSLKTTRRSLLAAAAVLSNDEESAEEEADRRALRKRAAPADDESLRKTRALKRVMKRPETTTHIVPNPPMRSIAIPNHTNTPPLPAPTLTASNPPPQDPRRWTITDESVFIEMLKTYGTSFNFMVDHLPGKTASIIQQHFDEFLIERNYRQYLPRPAPPSRPAAYNLPSQQRAPPVSASYNHYNPNQAPPQRGQAYPPYRNSAPLNTYDGPQSSYNHYDSHRAPPRPFENRYDDRVDRGFGAPRGSINSMLNSGERVQLPPINADFRGPTSSQRYGNDYYSNGPPHQHPHSHHGHGQHHDTQYNSYNRPPSYYR